jgi:hypothetical protein
MERRNKTLYHQAKRRAKLKLGAKKDPMLAAKNQVDIREIAELEAEAAGYDVMEAAPTGANRISFAVNVPLQSGEKFSP